MDYASRQTYKVVAIFEGRRKVMAQGVGAFKATRLAKKINAKGFEAEVIPNGGGDSTLYVLED
jgi:hypothetical protein